MRKTVMDCGSVWSEVEGGMDNTIWVADQTGAAMPRGAAKSHIVGAKVLCWWCLGRAAAVLAGRCRATCNTLVAHSATHLLCQWGI
jgi:hypothetical protein